MHLLGCLQQAQGSSCQPAAYRTISVGKVIYSAITMILVLLGQEFVPGPRTGAESPWTSSMEQRTTPENRNREAIITRPIRPNMTCNSRGCLELSARGLTCKCVCLRQQYANDGTRNTRSYFKHLSHMNV